MIETHVATLKVLMEFGKVIDFVVSLVDCAPFMGIEWAHVDAGPLGRSATICTTTPDHIHVKVSIDCVSAQVGHKFLTNIAMKTLWCDSVAMLAVVGLCPTCASNGAGPGRRRRQTGTGPNP